MSIIFSSSDQAAIAEAETTMERDEQTAAILRITDGSEADIGVGDLSSEITYSQVESKFMY